MERDDIEKAAKHYQEKDHDIWTGKGMATEIQKPSDLVQSGVSKMCGMI